MASISLLPSYKQYKADSDAVATWLAHTAAQYGYAKDPLINEAASQQKNPRLKGKARKFARKATQTNSSESRSEDSKSEPVPEGPTYLISVKEFISFAEWITKSTKSQVEVPASFVSVLDRAITVRKRHQKWWYPGDKSIDEFNEEDLANKRHGYFILVLEKVRKILRPRMSAGSLEDSLVQPVGTAGASNESSQPHLVNLFENLQIEEPSDTFLNSEPTAQGQKPTSTPPVRYRLDQVPDLEEVCFAVHCLLNDFGNIRKYLQKVWEGHRQGAFDLVAASITTNTAIDFARRLQEDFNEAFPQYTDFEMHLNVLYTLLCLKSENDPDYRERPEDEFNLAVYEDIEPILLPTYALLSSFNDIVEPGTVPVYHPEHFGVYNPTSDRASKSPRDKYGEDQIVLHEILPYFCLLTVGPGNIPAEDELTRGIREMVKQNEVPIWLAFAAQIFLDIHHTLREHVTSGFGDLVKSATYVENSVEQVMKFHKKLHIKNWPKSNDQGLVEILDLIRRWVKTDVVEDTRSAMIRFSRFQSSSGKPFLFLKHHPWYCGLLSYCIKALAQEASIRFVNAWGSILYSAHLYNALRQENLISDSWQDMDLALLMHRPTDIFVGDIPKSADDYLKRFSLASGYSVTMFASNRRHSRIEASKSGPRTLNDISPVSRMFMTRYCKKEGFDNLSPDDIDTFLAKHTYNDDDTDSQSELTTPKIKIKSNAPVLASPTNGSPSRSLKHRRKTHTSANSGIRPIQLLNNLLNAIQSEILELTFDHFRLHTFSWRLLRSVQKELDNDLREIYGPRYLEGENRLPFVVGYIFMAASHTSKLANVLLPKKKDVVTDRLLVKAATVVKKMLESGAEGRTEVGMLKQHFGYEIKMPPDFMLLAGNNSWDVKNSNSGTEGARE